MRCLGGVPPRFTYITRASSKTSNVLPVQFYIYMHNIFSVYGQDEEQRRKLSCVVFESSVLRGSIILSCNPRTHCAHCLWQVMAGRGETWGLIILSLFRAVVFVWKQFNQFGSWKVEIDDQSHNQPKRCMKMYERNSFVAEPKTGAIHTHQLAISLNVALPHVKASRQCAFKCSNEAVLHEISWNLSNLSS